MKTICIAGKNDIAVDIMSYCMEYYPKNKIICIINRNETGINSWQKSLKWFAEKKHVDIVELEDVYEIKELLFLSLEFDRIIHPNKFKSQELYNVHFSMLPKYKGMYTSVLPILNGEKYTGVTLHKIRAGIDTGEIVDQSKVLICDDDSAFNLYKKLINNGTELVKKNLDNLLSGNVIIKPQSKRDSFYFSKDEIDYANLGLNVNNTAFQIQSQIRAFCFRPYQLLEWNGIKYIECTITDNVSRCKAGTIIEDNEVLTKISTIDYDAVLYKDVLQILLKAIVDGNNDRAKKLCVSKKIVESQDKHGWSPLTVAVYNNNFEMVKFLISCGADIHVVNNNGTNLLMYAKNCFINTGDSTIFMYLISNGLSPERRDYFGKNLFDYCKEEGISKIGEYHLT